MAKKKAEQKAWAKKYTQQEVEAKIKAQQAAAAAAVVVLKIFKWPKKGQTFVTIATTLRIKMEEAKNLFHRSQLSEVEAYKKEEREKKKIEKEQKGKIRKKIKQKENIGKKINNLE